MVRCDELRLLELEDKRRILMTSRTWSEEIDRERRVRMTGMIDLDVTKLPPTDGTHGMESQRPQFPEFAGAVEKGNIPR